MADNDKEDRFQRRLEEENAAREGLRAAQLGDPSQVKPTMFQSAKDWFMTPHELPDAAKDIMSAAYTPIRGTRALGVLGQKALQDMPGGVANFLLQNALPGSAPNLTQFTQMGANMPDALLRASEATRPGYQPLPDEKLGAEIGEGAGLAGMLGPVAGLPIVGQGLAGAGMAALQEGANKGTLTPSSAAMAGLESAAPATAITAVEKGLPPVLSMFSKVPRSALETARDVPSFFTRYQGRPHDIQYEAAQIGSTFENWADKVTETLNLQRSKTGVKLIAKEDVLNAIRANVGNRSLKEIEQDYSTLMAMEKGLAKEIPTGLIDAKGRPIYRKVQTPIPPDKKRLRDLYFMLREEEMVPKGSLAEIAHGLKRVLKAEMSKIPGGAALVKASEKYGEVMQVGRNLGEYLVNPKTSVNEAKRIANALIKEESSGLADALPRQIAAEVEGIKELEKKTGVNLLTNIKREVMSSMMRKATSDKAGLLTRLLAIFKPGLIAGEMALGSPVVAGRAMQAVGATGRAIRSTAGRAGIPAAVTMLRKRRDEQ